jgi:ribosomal protein S18 acetylase RimI-like enzyme
MTESDQGKWRIRNFIFPDDYPQIQRLWNEAGPGVRLGRSDTPAEVAKKIQYDPDLFLVAEHDGQIIASLLGGFDGRRGLVYHLAVAETFRQKGLGKYMMEELEQRLRGKGCLRCYLLVTKDNTEAIRFYESHGWQRMDLYTYGKDLV